MESSSDEFILALESNSTDLSEIEEDAASYKAFPNTNDGRS